MLPQTQLDNGSGRRASIEIGVTFLGTKHGIARLKTQKWQMKYFLNAYSMIDLEQDSLDVNDSEVSERFSEVKTALNTLDLILFLPITKENSIQYTEENSVYRKAAEKYFKKIYRDEVCDIFPRYGHPKIIEIWGDRAERIKKIDSYLL